MNAADEWTEKQLQALERRIAKEYRQAAREMKAKLDKHLSEYQREKSQRLKALDDTPEAKAEYKRWLESQTARAAWMNGMVTDLSGHVTNARQEAFRLVGQAMPGIFAENANRAAFEVDKAAKVDTRFTLMDEGTVKVLMRENPRLLPEPSVNVPKDQRWNRQKLASAITQGVLQGESIPDIAKRVQTVANMGYHSACGTARLAVTCAENVGRVSSYERARDMGIKLKQEWLATLDSRTRHSHRQLDGEKVEVGGTFSNGCRFPGDPDGPAEEVYGCRCTLVADVEGVDTSDAERWSKLGDMTYEEWKDERQTIARSATKGYYSGSFGSATEGKRSAYLGAEDMVALFNQRNKGRLEVEGKIDRLGRSKMAALYSGIEYGSEFVGTPAANVKLVSSRKIAPDTLSQIEKRDSDYVIRVNVFALRGKTLDEIEQIMFHEMAHTAECRLVSQTVYLSEGRRIERFSNGELALLKKTTVSARALQALNSAGIQAEYSEQYGKIAISGNGMKALRELPEYARVGAAKGMQDSELVAECIRFVGNNGHGANPVADAICRAFLEER